MSLKCVAIALHGARTHKATGNTRLAEQVDGASCARSGIAWHPDGGSLLAVPGRDDDVVFYERLSWAVAFALGGGHAGPVNLVSFSPNGMMRLARCCAAFLSILLICQKTLINLNTI